ncbi:hypothetical protein B9Z19DRAFT_1061204 [Tuber borchii]|uniref:Uncharacterized protein n=1 Tax=Tuber borchii TaxID=42251 RepID=A0A2T7A671_TUBBO|nr:hypothetical protein B9Z19DRAFT_1061204 [Tuber borchii]
MVVKCNVLANLRALADLGFLGLGLDAPELCHSQIPPTTGRRKVAPSGRSEPRLSAIETGRVLSPLLSASVGSLSREWTIFYVFWIIGTVIAVWFTHSLSPKRLDQTGSASASSR